MKSLGGRGYAHALKVVKIYDTVSLHSGGVSGAMSHDLHPSAFPGVPGGLYPQFKASQPLCYFSCSTPFFQGLNAHASRMEYPRPHSSTVRDGIAILLVSYGVVMAVWMRVSGGKSEGNRRAGGMVTTRE